MTDQRQQDEQVLLDYLLGRCDRAQIQAVLRRLEEDESFRTCHRNLQNALAALGLLPQLQAPAGLADRTIHRVGQIRTTEKLIARAELDRRTAYRSRFSLRELAAVASVVLLVGFAFYLTLGRGAAESLRDRKLAALCEAQMQHIGQAAMVYAQDHGGFLPASAAAPGPWLASGGQNVVSNSTALFQLIRFNYAPAEVFQCPAVVNPSTFAMLAGMTDFPEGRFITYSYQHTLGRTLSRNDPVLRAAAGEMAILADSNPLFAGGRFHPNRLRSPVSENHRSKGQNVLYLDNHVRWTDTPAAGVGGNNIFLAEGVYQYRGDETPVAPTDTFLLPTYSRN